MSKTGLWSDIEDRGPSVFAVTTATLALASVFVFARLYTRCFIVRHITWDDWFMILAWLFAFAIGFTIDYGTYKGLGKLDQNVALGDWDSLRRCEYVFSVLYNPALMATKTSILVFYLRLSRNTEQVLRLASWAVLGIVNIAGAVLTLLNVFQCRPVEAAFNYYARNAQCIPLLTEFICSAPVNIITDLAILALPLPVLTGMRLPPRQKIILVVTFALGIFVTVVDVVRIYYLQQAITDISPDLSTDPESSFGGQTNFAFNASLSLMWSSVEVNIGIACACVPTLKPLIIRILPSMLVDPDGTLRTTDTSTKQPSEASNRSGLGEGSVSLPGVARVAESPSAQVSAMEFLTTPDMMELGRSGSSNNLGRTPTGRTTATTTTVNENSVYFGFVNIRRPKSLMRTSVSESFKYCTVVGILFVLWGFSYGLLNTLNNVIAQVAGMTVAQTLGLTSMYFGAGYFFGPLMVGEWILRHDEHRRTRKLRHEVPDIGGFKATFMIGLCIYGIGTIMFWPSAVLLSFGGFMFCSFVVGFGLGVLETAANPFLILCGPMDYAEMRLLTAQGVQAVATVLAQLLAQKVFFTSVETADRNNSVNLLDVQWTYLAITLFCVALALFFYYMPLPEVTDAELENSTLYLPVDPTKRSIGGFELRTWTLVLAVAAQMDTTQADHGGDVDQPIGLVLTTSDYLLIAHTAFAVSRFLTAYLAYLSPTNSRVPQPRTILNICAGLGILFGVLIAAIKPTNPNLVVIPVVLFFFAEGPMWPLIYTLGLRGQGKRTKRAAAYITMGGSGAAFWPFVLYAINKTGVSYRIAFIVIPSLFIITAMFPLFLDLKRDARALVDARVGKTRQSRIQAHSNLDLDLDAIIASRGPRGIGTASRACVRAASSGDCPTR
ncbi:fucose permease [Apiospora marii]|uniref:Fucose permease n=1 Tax=Apiospora marii TaxID=335849 RepID=A0ABR1RSZ3_9PEZI